MKILFIFIILIIILIITINKISLKSRCSLKLLSEAHNLQLHPLQPLKGYKILKDQNTIRKICDLFNENKIPYKKCRPLYRMIFEIKINHYIIDINKYGWYFSGYKKDLMEISNYSILIDIIDSFLPSIKDKYQKDILHYDDFKWFNDSIIPEKFKDLIPYIKKFGQGDDLLRETFLKNITIEEKQKLINKVEPKLEEIDTLLDSYKNKNIIPAEIGCFMWLVEAYYEVKK